MGKDLLYWASTLQDLSKRFRKKDIVNKVIKMKVYF